MSSHYDVWVRTLREWSIDPATALDSLPALEESTYSAATWGRLLAHLTAALDEAARRWSEGVERSFREAGTPHDLARALVSLRKPLFQRWRLCAHPSLPDAVRTSLTDGFRHSTERCQDELENAVRRQGERGQLNRKATEELLTVLRQNSFRGVMLEADGSKPAHGSETAVLPGPAPTCSEPITPGRRRIFH